MKLVLRKCWYNWRNRHIWDNYNPFNRGGSRNREKIKHSLEPFQVLINTKIVNFVKQLSEEEMLQLMADSILQKIVYETKETENFAITRIINDTHDMVRVENKYLCETL